MPIRTEYVRMKKNFYLLYSYVKFFVSIKTEALQRRGYRNHRALHSTKPLGTED